MVSQVRHFSLLAAPVLGYGVKPYRPFPGGAPEGSLPNSLAWGEYPIVWAGHVN
jgi:hypothetical protein